MWARRQHPGEQYSAGAKASAVVAVWSTPKSAPPCAEHREGLGKSNRQKAEGESRGWWVVRLPGRDKPGCHMLVVAIALDNA